ncbi:MAG: RICIN domain-containing protein [Eubacteriaceae bacterium]|jgi:hypothetical protein
MVKGKKLYASLSFVLILALLLSVFPSTIFGAGTVAAAAVVGDTFEQDGITYAVTSVENTEMNTVNEVQVQKATETRQASDSLYGTFIVPEQVTNQGVSYDVTAVGTQSFYGVQDLKNVVMTDSIDSVATDAFVVTTDTADKTDEPDAADNQPSVTIYAPADSPAADYAAQNKLSLVTDGITLSDTALQMNVSEDKTVTVTGKPDWFGDNPVYTWKSSTDTVASVDENGKITAVAGGTTVITATCNGISASVTVTVVSNTQTDAVSEEGIAAAQAELTAQAASAAKDSVFSVATNDGQVIKSYTTDGKEYLFLPSSVDLANMTIMSNDTIATSEVGTVANGQVSGAFENNSTFTITLSNKKSYKVCIMQSNLPCMNITLSGTDIATINGGSKDTKYEGNSVNFYQADGTASSYTNVEMKGRGNTTWGMAKKPYQIKFDSKTKLLDLNKSKKYVLLANHTDGSLMRNQLVLDLAANMGMKASPKSNSVDLWVDGEYLGNYLLAQKNDVNDSSLDLKNSDGVLGEIDNLRYGEEDPGYAYQTKKSGTHIVLKEYKADTETEGFASMKSMISKIDKFESALYADNKDWSTISKLIDPEEFATYYLLQEFSGNVDAMVSSSYVYTDGAADIVHIGPVWDYDLAMGNSPYVSSGKLWINNNTYNQSIQNTWYQELMKIPEFRQTVSKVYKENASAKFAGVQDEVTRLTGELQQSQSMNFTRWKILGGSNPYAGGKSLAATYQENVDGVSTWIANRSALMEEKFGIASADYSVYETTTGWTSSGSNGDTVGLTDEQGISGFRVSLRNLDTTSGTDSGVKYRIRTSSGWGTYAEDGAVAGFTSNKTTAEAIQIKLTTDELNNNYSIYYRAYCQGLGWQDWASDGASAGSKGYNTPVMAIQVKLVKKGDPAPGKTANPYPTATSVDLVDGGIYTISSALSSSKVLDIAGGSTSNGGNLQIYSANGSAAQQFIAQKNNDGTWTFVNYNSNKAMDLKGYGTMNGTNVQQYSSNGTNAQRWKLVDYGSGNVMIKSVNGKCLDVAGGSSANGTNVQVYSSNGSNAQLFKFTKVGAVKKYSGTYTFKSSMDNTKVMDVNAGSILPGANVQLYTKNGSSAQKFTLEYAGGDSYVIRNVNSGMVLDVAGASTRNGANINQYLANGTNAQKWQVKQNSDGTFTLISKCNGKAIDVSGGSTADGANIQCYSSNGSSAQKWVMSKSSNY